MFIIFKQKTTVFLILILCSLSCAYFNTFYNAKQYFDEAEKIRLEKDGETIPITAMDKYGKTIKKCQTVLDDHPDSRFVIDATLLMSKARYYRSDYDLAISGLKTIQSIGSNQQKEEATYWLALCKWKKGSVQAGLNELNELLVNATQKDIRAKCHLSLAELAKELKDQDLALSHLQLGAKLTTERAEKGVIYGRLAEMAFNKEDYELAREGYNNVIAHSLSKENVEKAHLQILKILRVNNNYKAAQRKIKSMLVDDKFKRISGNLELELVQLYRAQGESEEIELRLESIVNDYQRTQVSAEAYYQLGQIYTSEKWNLDKAKEYYDNVSKESSRSLFSPMAKSHSRSITTYLKAQADIDRHKNMLEASESISQIDSKDSTERELKSVSIEKAPDRDLPELYYQLADLEAFSFNRYNESEIFLNKIIKDYPESEFRPKAMFALIFVYESLEDLISTGKIKNDLLTIYPQSEYAAYISDEEINIEIKGQKKVFMQAESQITDNIDNAIKLYRSVLNIDPSGEYAAPAAYSIGYHYDQVAVIDSAVKYYHWLKDNHPTTEQSIEADKRLNKLSLVLATIKSDTTTDNSQEEN